MVKTNVLLVLLIALSSFPGARESVTLDGAWRFRMDPDNQGRTQRWHMQKLPETVQLPGTMAQNQKGEANNKRDVTMNLSRPIGFVGNAWYQRDMVIPQEWANQHITLNLERSKLTSVWIDDQLIGRNNSLGCQQVYDLTGKVKPGKHTLTICVDNKTKPGESGGHQITDQTQTNWNGIIGTMALRVDDPVWIKRVLVYPDLQEKRVRIKLTLGNITGAVAKGTITMDASCQTNDHAHLVQPASYSFAADSTSQTVESIYLLGEKAFEWDEFTPNLYTLNVTLKADKHTDTRTVRFGLRQFKTDGTQFSINGRKTFLRGKHDALVWPVLGYPSMDVNEWVRVLNIAKSYGINHYRFHSCTPPEAAFDAADRVGIYLQPELYHFGTNLSKKPDAISYNIEEGLRILQTYGNHPSFVMFTLGNEMHGGRDVRAGILRKFRAFDSSRLYAQASNYDFRDFRLEKEDDYWTTVRTAPTAAAAVRGSFSHADLPLGHIQTASPSTQYDYTKALENTPVPVIGHETGQFQVFPNFDEIKKYTGVQQPWNLEVFAGRLKNSGMYDQWPDFFKASGALAVICYREEIEAALRTPGFGGFQLLDLQDFPGQGTALVGILDAFMDSKGLITPENWRQFCCEVVPLARMDKYTWKSGESFDALLQVANYGPQDIQNQTFLARVIDGNGKTLVSKQWKHSEAPLKQGEVTDVGHLKLEMPAINQPMKLSVKIEMLGTPYKNEYPLWLYPEKNLPPASDLIHVQRKLDIKTMKLLSQGERVLLIPEKDQMPNSVEGFFASDFWCFPMFHNITKSGKMKSAPGTLGILCNPKHPALSQFPTESHSNWQWNQLVMNSRAMILDGTPADYRPVVQVIDNFDRNHKLGLIFECSVGRGKLLVCSIDLPRLLHLPEARQLYTSLLAYVNSKEFNPKAAFKPELVANLFGDPADDSTQKDIIEFSQFFNGDQKNPPQSEQ